MDVIEVTEREIEIIEVIQQGPQGAAGPQPDINYTVVSSNRTLEAADLIAADTSGGSFTLTLPANPSNGDAVDIFDFSETFDTNNLTVARNGSKIESLTEDLICNVEGAYFTLIYTGAIRGWQVLPRYGTSGGGGESVLTTQGDTLYRAVGVNARLPIGTAGQALRVNSGATAPEWDTLTAADVGAANATHTHALSDLTQSGANPEDLVTWDGSLGQWVSTNPTVWAGANIGPADIGAAATSHASTHADGGSDSIQPFAGIRFDTINPDATPSVAQMVWNDTDGTVDMLLKGGNVNAQIGESTHHRVYNDSGAPIAKGKVVYLFGSQGQRTTIRLADNASDTTSARTLGITAEAIADNAEGFVISEGVIKNVNTNGLADGTILWLGTSGNYVGTRPTQPAHGVFLGVVVKGNSTGGGSIFVRIANGQELDELHDVLISSPSAGQVLARNVGNTLWVNKTLTASDISDSTSAGRTLLTAASTQAQRDALDVFVGVANFAALPTPGVTVSSGGSVYVTEDNGKVWVWNGSAYAEISPNTHTRAGSANTFVNDTALASALLSGPNNTAIGTNALNGNTTGGQNTAVGATALQFNLVADYNTGIGFEAMSANAVTGSFNTAVGIQTCKYNTTGNRNTACGAGALRDNTTGAFNTAVGFTSLQVATGSSNVAVGSASGDAVTTGANNTLIGTSADVDSGARELCIVLGSGATSPPLNGTLSIGGSMGAAMINLITPTAPIGATTYLRIWLNGTEYRIPIQAAT